MKGKMKMWMDYSGVPECQSIYIDLQWHCMALWTGLPVECIWEVDFKKREVKRKPAPTCQTQWNHTEPHQDN